jgi:hypothetical protein
VFTRSGRPCMRIYKECDNWAICRSPSYAFPPLQHLRPAPMNKPKKSVPDTHRGLLLASNLAIGVACPGLTTALQSGNSEALRSDHTNVALDASIMSFKGIKEIAEALPRIGESLKSTCGVMILVLETIKVTLTIVGFTAADVNLDVQKQSGRVARTRRNYARQESACGFPFGTVCTGA